MDEEGSGFLSESMTLMVNALKLEVEICAYLVSKYEDYILRLTGGHLWLCTNKILPRLEGVHAFQQES